MTGLLASIALALALAATLLRSHRGLRKTIGSTPAHWSATVILLGSSLTVLLAGFVPVKAVTLWLALTSITGLASVMAAGIHRSSSGGTSSGVSARNGGLSE